MPGDKQCVAEAGGRESPQEFLLFKGPANAAAPQDRVGSELGGNLAAADDIADDGPSAGAEHAEDLAEKLLAVGFVDEV